MLKLYCILLVYTHHSYHITTALNHQTKFLLNLSKFRKRRFYVNNKKKKKKKTKNNNNKINHASMLELKKHLQINKTKI